MKIISRILSDTNQFYQFHNTTKKEKEALAFSLIRRPTTLSAVIRLAQLYEAFNTRT